MFWASEWDLRVPSSSIRARPSFRGLGGSSIELVELESKEVMVIIVFFWDLCVVCDKVVAVNDSVEGAAADKHAATLTNFDRMIFLLFTDDRTS